ncbi:MAG: paraquat-inducible protein A [Gammaproteobacteria bacterium]
MPDNTQINSSQNDNLAICHECDVLMLVPPLSRSERAHCPRCKGILREGDNSLFNRLLPLTITGFILFFLANIFPLLSISASGQIIEATILSSSSTLWEADQRFLAFVVFTTTFLTPLLQLLAYAWLLLPPLFGKIPAMSDSVLRLSHHSVPWNMIEIFLLGFLVAVVKLGEQAVIITGPSLYAFVFLIILMTLLNNLFDPPRVRHEMHLRQHS